MDNDGSGRITYDEMAEMIRRGLELPLEKLSEGTNPNPNANPNPILSLTLTLTLILAITGKAPCGEQQPKRCSGAVGSPLGSSNTT